MPRSVSAVSRSPPASTGVISTPWTRCSSSRSRYCGLAAWIVVAVAQIDRQTRRLRGLLDAARNVGEERVGRIEHHVTEAPAAAGPELAGVLVAHEPQLLDRVEHSLPGDSATTWGRFSTFDTVPSDTPARAATSFTPTLDMALPLGHHTP